MATVDEIVHVSELLGPDAPSGGWDHARINNDLDAGKLPDEIAYEWWSHRAAMTANLVNVSEQGSSRGLGGIHSNALNLAERYRARLDSSSEETSGSRARLRSFPIRRV